MPSSNHDIWLDYRSLRPRRSAPPKDGVGRGGYPPICRGCQSPGSTFAQLCRRGTSRSKVRTNLLMDPGSLDFAPALRRLWITSFLTPCPHVRAYTLVATGHTRRLTNSWSHNLTYLPRASSVQANGCDAFFSNARGTSAISSRLPLLGFNLLYTEQCSGLGNFDGARMVSVDELMYSMNADPEGGVSVPKKNKVNVCQGGGSHVLNTSRGISMGNACSICVVWRFCPVVPSSRSLSLMVARVHLLLWLPHRQGVC